MPHTSAVMTHIWRQREIKPFSSGKVSGQVSWPDLVRMYKRMRLMKFDKRVVGEDK